MPLHEQSIASQNLKHYSLSIDATFSPYFHEGCIQVDGVNLEPPSMKSVGGTFKHQRVQMGKWNYSENMRNYHFISKHLTEPFKLPHSISMTKVC